MRRVALDPFPTPEGPGCRRASIAEQAFLEAIATGVVVDDIFVMLNKGPNITATVDILGTIVARFNPRQSENPRHREKLHSCLAFRTNGPASERKVP